MARPRLNTLIDILDRVRSRPRPDLLSVKVDGGFRPLSTSEFEARVSQLAAFLAEAGAGHGERVALLSENRPEWTIADFAIQLAGAVNVPIYTTSSREQVGYILADSGARIVLVSRPELVAKVAAVAAQAPSLRRMVVFDPPASPSNGRAGARPERGIDPGEHAPPALAGGNSGEVHGKSEGNAAGGASPAGTRGEQRRAHGDAQARPGVEGAVYAAAAEGVGTDANASEAPGKAPGPAAVSLEEAYGLGAACLLRQPELLERCRRAVGPNDLASIIYTSGTTGEPKGVMLTHANFCSNIETCLGLIPFGEKDLALSFLPLSHVFERTVEYLYLAAGGAIAYAESVEKLPEDLLAVRPTVLSTVPRLLEKIHLRILERARSAPRWKGRLFDWSLAAGAERLKRRLAGRPGLPVLLRAKLALAERLVFSRIKAALGGRVGFMVSGGAPLQREIAEFFLAAGITILEGYGLTETSPVVSVNTFEHFRPGTVGRPIPGVEVRIAQDGEILVRGPNVMKGYFRRPEATEEVMREGFFATGDIGTIDADGFLVILDRKKDLLITSGGKNVAPQPIEGALKSSRYVANAVLIGDRRNFISALIVPNFEALKAYAAQKGWGAMTPSRLIGRPEVRELIGAEIDKATACFAQFEKIRKFALLEFDFTVESGEMTPTMKVRRRVILERYSSAIEAMYQG